MKRDILGVSFDNVTMTEAVAAGSAMVKQGGFHYVVTPNPELVNLSKTDDQYRRILNAADLVLPDGVGILYAARILGTPLRERVPGIDFAAGLLAYMTAAGTRLYLLGAKPGVAEKAQARLKAHYPGLVICGLGDGYFKNDLEPAEDMRRVGAQVAFVCLGAPKQEKWIARYGPQTGARLMVGLGGVLDVYAGNVKRAPLGWQKLGLEWAYRLTQEPSRLGRMAKLPLFLLEAAGERHKSKK